MTGFNFDQFSNIPSTVSPSETLHSEPWLSSLDQLLEGDKYSQLRLL